MPINLIHVALSSFKKNHITSQLNCQMTRFYACETNVGVLVCNSICTRSSYTPYWQLNGEWFFTRLPAMVSSLWSSGSLAPRLLPHDLHVRRHYGCCITDYVVCSFMIAAGEMEVSCIGDALEKAIAFQMWPNEINYNNKENYKTTTMKKTKRSTSFNKELICSISTKLFKYVVSTYRFKNCTKLTAHHR